MRWLLAHFLRQGRQEDVALGFFPPGVEGGSAFKVGADGGSRTAEEIVDDLIEGLRASVFGAEIGAVDVGAAGLATLDNSLPCETIEDRHDGGVSAGAALGKAIANFADRAFTHGPERVHAIKLERSKVKYSAPVRFGAHGE
jgi:hypothetical protein